LDTFEQLLKFDDPDDVWRINADAIIFKKDALGKDGTAVEFDMKRYREEFRECPRNCFDAWDDEKCNACMKLKNVKITQTKYLPLQCQKYTPCRACEGNHGILKGFDAEIDQWITKKPNNWGEDFNAYYANIPRMPILLECERQIPDSRWKQNGLAPEWIPIHHSEFDYSSLPVFDSFHKYDLYNGIGGGGKSFSLVVLDNKALVNPLFITKTHALNADMKKTAREHGIELDTLSFEAVIRRPSSCGACAKKDKDTDLTCAEMGICSVCKKNPVGLTLNQKKRFDWINQHGIILFDEAPQYPVYMWKRLEEFFPNHKIIYLGDSQHQLPPFPDAEQEILIKNFWGGVRKFTEQYRAKTQVLKEINTELRGIVDDIWEDKKTHADLVKRLKEIFKHQTSTYEEMKRDFTDQDIIINSVNDKKDKNTKDLPHIQIHKVIEGGDGYFVGNIIHGDLPECFRSEAGSKRVVRQVAHTAHAYQGQTFKGRRLYIDLNGMEKNAGHCFKHSRMIEVCVGRCIYETQVWLVCSPHKYDVLKTGYLYKISNTKSGHFYLGSSFDVKGRWKQHKEEFLKDDHQCESFLVYEQGVEDVREEIIGTMDFCFPCKSCKDCKRKGICAEWKQSLLEREGEWILLNQGNPKCVNKQVPYKKIIQKQY